jgi:phosphomannomutase
MNVDFGFAHDGDADRLVMVSRSGTVLPDFVVSILALRALGVRKGTIVISENTSVAVEEAAKKQGLKVLRSTIGKTFAAIESEGAVFATEPSKVVDPSWGLWEDGINAAAMISNLISREPGALTAVLDQTKWYYRQVNVSMKADMPAVVVKARDAFERYRIVEERKADGHKFVFHDGSWAMFRASGTEPKTRIYCEAKDPQLLEQLVQLATQCVESSL